MRTRIGARFILSGLLLTLLAALTWPSAPSRAAPVPGISALFPGTPGGATSTASGPADGLFASLANTATTSIDVAMYDFDRAQVRDALLAAKGRGVAVRVVGDNDDSVDPSYAPFYQSLSAAAIPLVVDNKSSLMHNKFAVFDGQVTWTGSANFSNNAFSRNGENVVVITDTVVANIYAAEFAEMFGGKFSNDKTDNTAHSATVGTTPVEIAFAPTDGVEQRIVNAINSADTSVKVAMFTFTNATIAQALVAAHNRGVQVDVLLDNTSAGSQFSQRDPLCAAGIAVRTETWPGLLHDKYAIVDAGTASDPLVLTGSTNWTANAVQANDENILIVHDATLATTFAANFASLKGAIGAAGFACNTNTSRVYLPLLTYTALPDLVIGGMIITPQAGWCAATGPLGLQVSIFNTGAGSAGPFVVDADAMRQEVAGLASGHGLTLWFPGYINGLNTVALDVTNAVAESDETNNVFTQVLTGTPLPCPSAAAKITGILYDPPDTISEYVTITNQDDRRPGDMTGWTLRDLAGNVYTFPTFTLPAGASVKVWTKAGTNDAANLYWGRSQPVWNNTGDTAILRDAQGNEVSRFSYP